MTSPCNYWVISGAGSRASWEAGVMIDLWKTEGKPDRMFGCSAGALCAAGMSCGGPDVLTKVLLSIKSMSDVFCNQYNPFSKNFWLGRYSSDPLRKIIEGIMASPRGVPFSVLYSDLANVCPVIEHNPQPEHVLASASIPAVVPPVNGTLVDGGVFHNCPLQPAVDLMGNSGGTITVILGSTLNPKYAPDWKPKNAIDVGVRALDALTDQAMRNDVAIQIKNQFIKIRLIEPPSDWSMGTLEFTPAKIRQALALGSQWRSYNVKS